MKRTLSFDDDDDNDNAATKHSSPSVPTSLKRVRSSSTSMDFDINNPSPRLTRDLSNLLGVVQWAFKNPKWAEKLDPRLKDMEHCENILGDDPDLLDTIRNCTDTNDWKPLLLFLEKHYAKKNSPENSPIKDMAKLTAQRKATENAWRTEFVGSSHQRLLARLESISNKEESAKGVSTEIYSNILPIVQSSGMGKSRMVDELAKLVFTIPICLRGEGDTGFPNGDPSILAAFKPNITHYEDEIAPKVICVTIFAAIFDAVSEELERCKVGSPLEWYNRLQEVSPSEGVPIRDLVYWAARQIIDKSTHTNSELKAAVQTMDKSLAMLLGHLPLNDRHSKLKLVLYVDECQTLTSIVLKNDPQRRTMLDFLAFAFDQCSSRGLFGIVLSTNSILSQVSFPRDILPSAREVTAGFNTIPAPFVHLNYDIWRNNKFIITESEMTLDDVCKTDFLARFGRPLWWTRITDPVSGAINNDIAHDLRVFAAQKLTGCEGGSFTDPRSRLDNAIFAILSVRLCLELEPSRISSKRLAEILVASHMSIAYHVPAHKEYMRSGHSSEPILAEAAANLWNDGIPAWGLFEPLTLLAQVVGKGLLAKGERGELAARFVLLRAQDIALENLTEFASASESANDGYARYSRPVPLWYFFEALFNKEKFHALSSQTARNRRKGSTLKKACENKYVRFSHFARAGDSSVLSTTAGWKAIARANAWQCYDRQELVDIVIPVFMAVDKKNAKLNRSAITFILIQVKNRKRAQTVHFSAETLGLFDDAGTRNKIPYFIIIFNFGVSSGTVSQSYPAISSPARLKAVSHSEKVEEDDPQGEGHPCYWLEVTGCSSNVLNSEIIPEGSKELRLILGSHSITDEAVDAETKTAIQTLKPNFIAGSASFGWSEDAREGPTPRTMDVEEVLNESIIAVQDEDEDE